MNVSEATPFNRRIWLIGIIFLKNISIITRPKIDILSLLLSTIGFERVYFCRDIDDRCALHLVIYEACKWKLIIIK
ncbi:hypothetical protein FPZ45_01580 [Cohnella terricola]|uniref:Uncharacterized protein n=1 Tax=Cohnella terricola TaxID=1289167 RepID=A0A559JWP6_9BACL|nr:hypothetical protein FPZ45_01580 [Cohnella terricola]